MKDNGLGCMVAVRTEGVLIVTGEGENKVVIDTRKATVLFGGSRLIPKTDDGTVMPFTEFDERLKGGVTCAYNPNEAVDVGFMSARKRQIIASVMAFR